MGRLVFVVAVLALGHTAFAEPDAADKQRAAELATESAAHYKRGEFEVSVVLLRQAYALYPQPNLQYNLARSLESIGDVVGAIEAYKLYLASETAIEDRGAIERRVTMLEQQLAAQKPALPVEPTPVPPPPQPKPARTTEVIVAGPRDEGPSATPWLAIGTGVAIAGAGVAFGVLANNAHDHATQPTTSGLDEQRDQDTAHRDATIANICYAVGAVALVSGVIWEIHERGAHHDKLSLRVGVGTATLALEF